MQKILTIFLTISLIYNGYQLKEIKEQLEGSTILLDSKIESLSFNTDGKFDDVSKKINEISRQKNTTVIEKEIQYVQKESSDDADVELSTQSSRVAVKVNDGKIYNFNLLPTETSKFEDGKLLINSAYSTSLNITAPEIERSRYQLITAMNSDKEMIGGLNYELGNTLSATFLVGQGVKPYYGFTWRIGGHK